MRYVLVSCCGLPAAGKTTFCRSVVSDSTATSAVTRSSTTAAAADSQLKHPPQIRVSHVCFDEHIDRARQQRRGSSSENSPSSNTHQKQQQEEEEQDEEENEDGQERNNYRQGSDNERDVTERSCKHANSAADIDTIGTTHEDDSIEAPRVTETTQCAGLPEAAATSEGGGKDGARWWHEGRRAALAEIEDLAAQMQAETITPACKAAPVITASSMTTNAVASAAKRRGSSRKEQPIHRAINSAFTTTPTSSAETGGSVDSAEIPRHGVANSAAAMAVAEAMMGFSAERQEIFFSAEESTIHLVLADDNMHFRSMRHEVFRLARKYGCGYAQVYFPTDVELAVERNKTRSTPVAEAVVRKMASSIQPPDPERFRWEHHTAFVGPLQAASIVVPPPEGDPPQPRPAAVVESDGGGLNTNPSWRNSSRTLCASRDALEEVDEASREEGAPDGVGAPHSFWRTIAAAAVAEYLVLPLSPGSSSARLLEQETDRHATRASLLHQFDLELRESVKRVAETATGAGLTRDVLRTVMSACSASRKQVMRRVRAAGNLNGARQVDWNIAASVAANQNGEGGDGGGALADHGGSKAAVAGGALATRRTVCGTAAKGRSNLALTHPCLPHVEQFVSEFEAALGTIDGMEHQARESLVEAARGPAAG